jgi:hypothetical protein
MCVRRNQKLKTDLNITTTPSFVFLHMGENLTCLDKLKEADPTPMKKLLKKR